MMTPNNVCHNTLCLKEHNEMCKQIAELQEKLSLGGIAYNDLMEHSKKVMDEYTSDIADLKDKLHRRNLQIADLKKKLSKYKQFTHPDTIDDIESEHFV